jgi:hypothetical protein
MGSGSPPEKLMRLLPLSFLLSRLFGTDFQGALCSLDSDSVPSSRQDEIRRLPQRSGLHETVRYSVRNFASGKIGMFGTIGEFAAAGSCAAASFGRRQVRWKFFGRGLQNRSLAVKVVIVYGFNILMEES